MIRHDWTPNLVRVGLALGLLALTAAGPAAASDDESYGYFRAIDGSATLIQAGSATRTPAEINQPVMAGDRILVTGSSRAEIVLPDRNILRLDGGTEVTLEALAASPDRDDPTTVLRLHDGNILLTVITDSLGDQLPRVDTPNASVYPQAYGTYRITSSQDRWTEVTARRGKAEVVTDGGSSIVRAGETGIVEGDRQASIESAASYDSLERWASSLEDEARYASTNDEYVDDNLRYQAAPLARYGSWVSYSGRSYWRPRVAVGWSPYSQGRWAYTPAGLTWVSYEPWGWVPYHYGSWDYLPNYGWAWQAGRTWAPAWVYWYWGPSYVGWCPTGYYTSYYRNSYSHFRYGVYGWAGGSWDHWNHWTFVNTDYFRGYRNGYRNGYRDGRHDDWNVGRHAVPIDQLRRNGPLDRGVITTDTRPLKPETWDDPRHAIRVLTEGPGGRPRYNQAGGAPGAAGGELPDVTPFIERRRELPAGVVRTVVADGGGDQTGRGAGGARPRTSTPGGGSQGGGIATIPTNPSTDRRGGAVPRERQRPDGNGAVRETPATGGNTPRSRVPSESSPRSGGAPRPEQGGRIDTGNRTGGRPADQDRGGQVETQPRVRVPRESSPQAGGAPRPDRTTDRTPSRTDERQSPPSSSQDRNRERGGAARPETPRSYTPPPSSTRERERDRDQQSGSRGGYSRPQTRPQTPPSYSPPPSSSRERERERYSPPSPPPSSSRPAPEASPSRPERERARPSEPRRDEGSRSSSQDRSRQGSESRGGESRGGSGRQSRDRRPPA